MSWSVNGLYWPINWKSVKKGVKKSNLDICILTYVVGNMNSLLEFEKYKNYFALLYQAHKMCVLIKKNSFFQSKKYEEFPNGQYIIARKKIFFCSN